MCEASLIDACIQAVSAGHLANNRSITCLIVHQQKGRIRNNLLWR